MLGRGVCTTLVSDRSRSSFTYPAAWSYNVCWVHFLSFSSFNASLHVWEKGKRVKCRRESNVCLYTVVCWVCVSVCVMSGDTSTLSWRSMSPTSQSDSSDVSPSATVARDNIFPVKIIKVCFLSNSCNLGKNFKLVRCEEGWTVRVYSTLLYLLFYSTVLYYSTLLSYLLHSTYSVCFVLCCILI